MRKKIQITTDEPLESEGAPPVAPDAAAPEFGNHVNPPNSPEASGDGTTAGTAENHARRAPDSGASAYITALQAELEEARAKREEAEKQILYQQAEFQNFRRRQREEQAELQRFANSELIRDLLPILDNFERALAAAEQTRSFDALIGGVSGTLKQLQAFLQKAGVQPIESVGKEFDPRYHEAVGHAESSDLPANTVAEEVQRGYQMHDRVLRPALVKVASDS